jgi:hypothetical protein
MIILRLHNTSAFGIINNPQNWVLLNRGFLNCITQPATHSSNSLPR